MQVVSGWGSDRLGGPASDELLFVAVPIVVKNSTDLDYLNRRTTIETKSNLIE